MPDIIVFARSSRARHFVLFGFVLFAALSRLVPHPPNFTPVGAMALFGGAYFGSRAVAFMVPLTAMLLSDIALAFLQGWSLGVMTVVIYSCIAFSVWLGIGLRGAVRTFSVVQSSLFSATIFFVVTNFTVWMGSSMYSANGMGLLECYIAALPFFGNTLAGYATYGLLMFGGFTLLQRRFDSLALRDPVSV